MIFFNKAIAFQSVTLHRNLYLTEVVCHISTLTLQVHKQIFKALPTNFDKLKVS